MLDRRFYSNEELFCQVPDIYSNFKFDDYREPNEGTPVNIQPHLALMDKGWIVSTGTERSFFDLLLSPEDKCEGLIIRDINPKVKAYCDFLVLLLCCAKNKEHFTYLSDRKHAASTDQIKNEIFSILETIDISPVIKAYFKDNFEILASCYLDRIHLPNKGSNKEVDYRLNDSSFEKLKKYALTGKIIPMVGDINDLELLKGRKITIIDTSNVSDYISIQPKNYGDSIPRIIFTNQGEAVTEYRSGLFSANTKAQSEKIQKYFNLFTSSKAIANFISTAEFSNLIPEENDIFNKPHVSCYMVANVIKIKKCLLAIKKSGFALFFSSSFTPDAQTAFTNVMAGKEPKTELEKVFTNLMNEDMEVLKKLELEEAATCSRFQLR